VQLYRFGQSAAAGANAAARERVTVLYTGTSLPRAAGGDRILTASGPEVSYVGASRWSSPAVVLFEEAVVRGFEGTAVRLVRRGATSRADATLRIEVRTFEARYAAPDTPPTIVIESRALLTPVTIAAELIDADFSVQSLASENRVTAIAQAFDAATSDLVAQVVAWTSATAGPVQA
jgi:cholesterol transport system auxiliary component